MNILKLCFEKRLERRNIDTSINQFEIVIERLNQSLISIVDVQGKKCVRVINPSVNDFLKMELENNRLEKESLRNSINSLYQIERLYSKDEQKKVLVQFINNHRILALLTNNEDYKAYKIVSIIAQNKICDTVFKDTVRDYFIKYFVYGDYYLYENSKHILKAFLKGPLSDFYGINNILYDENKMECMFSCLDFQNISEVIEEIYAFYKLNNMGIPNWFVALARRHIKDLNENFILNDLNVSDYCPDDVDPDKGDIDSGFLNGIVDDINSVIVRNFLKLPYGIVSSNERIYVDSMMIEDEVNSYYRNSDVNQYRSTQEDYTLRDIEYIFERELSLN